MTMARPKLAVWKFASCDGCQLSILDCEDELLAIADRIDIAYFPEASSRMAPGPYDLSLVEGSITTADDVARIAFGLGFEFSGDELLRFSGQKVGRVTVSKQEHPGEYH